MGAKALESVQSFHAAVRFFTDQRCVQLSLALEILYPIFISFIKSALFFLYLECFTSVRWLRRLIYVGMSVTGVGYLAAATSSTACCAPHGSGLLALYTSLNSHSCQIYSGRAVNYGLGVFNLVSDMYLLLIPLPAVWSLQLPTRRKIGVFAIFLTGIV